ncbi:MAG: hypothetical protein NZ773_02905, partial [Dehalococcoidia bacterium]|nr:hypothetical protein [Dehalococcoidia bacterium]
MRSPRLRLTASLTILLALLLTLLSTSAPAARADSPPRLFFPLVSTHEPPLQSSPNEPPTDGILLPPPKSGLAFPQPSRLVGSPAAGAALLANDRAERVVIAPNSFTIRPGEERLLGVWVADEAGNRFAGDPSYLDLLLYNPAGYDVSWAGPGQLRVKAPDSFRSDLLVINVRRKDMEEGRRFINGLANATMVVPTPEAVVLPEAVVGLP